MHNEECHVLLGRTIGHFWYGRFVGYWQGAPSHVDFDPKYVEDREDSHGDVVGFWHTHPVTHASPSSTDYKTMGGWTLSFGRPLVCTIDGTDGLRAHWFLDDEHDHVEMPVYQVSNWLFGLVPTKEQFVKTDDDWELNPYARHMEIVEELWDE
jgi:hypothetical protein